MAERPRPRLPINRMIPNILTLIALCSGLSAIRFAYEGRWEHAALAILISAILDGLDGRIARLLKGTSKFGAELDSLSDFVCFGIAPAMMLYFWTMQDAGRFGWFLVLLFAVSCVLRLARFNTAMEDPEPSAWSAVFFTGVPTPAGAGLVLLPMILSFQMGDEYFRRPELVAVFMIGVSVLLVSRIPTYAFKKVKLSPSWILPTMLGAGLLTASLLSAPWATLSIILLVYLFSIPFSVRTYRRMKATNGSLFDNSND